MQFGKKMNISITQQRMYQNDGYEIKTYTTNVRNRSPIPNPSNYVRRSPIKRDQRSIDSGGGELKYIEPNEMNYQNMSQIQTNYIVRSPINQNDEYYHQYQPEYERAQLETSQQIRINDINNMGRVPQFNLDLDKRRERLSRSPKTINIGETPAEVEYNMRTIQGRNRSPKMSMGNSPLENPLVERSYNMMSEAGNIFMDQQMGQPSFIRQNEIMGSPGFMQQTSYEMKESNDFRENNREIRYAMNPRDLQEPRPGILQKMSPHANVEGDSDSASEKNDNINQIKDLKTQLERRNIGDINIRNDDGMIEARQLPNEMDKYEDMVRMKEQENITGDEVRKLVTQYVRAYDPRRDTDGNLISNKQTVLQSKKDEMFNDRYKVLQKMNKLSNILLAKNKNSENDGYNVKTYADKTFDRKTLNSTVIGGNRNTRNVTRRKPKFYYASLAMLASKGLNTEDRVIPRGKRKGEKGGVVDLGQEKLEKKFKFKIKKVKATGRGYNMVLPKYREKAAKIVQGWWRERKQKYKKILDQIIKIQSVYRGRFTRKYVYDIIFMGYLHQKFLDIINRTLVNHIRPKVWDEFFSRKKLLKEAMGKLLAKNDKRYTALRIRPYFMRWDAIANFLKRRILKSEKLVIKKGDDEQRKKLLKKYMDEWILRTNLAKYIGKAKDAEEKKQKFFGTLDLMNGLTKLSKRTVQKNTQEPIKNYLRELLKQKLLKKIIENKKRNNLNILLRHYLHKWKECTNQGKFKDFKRDIFAKNYNRVHSRMDKIKLKYYFDKWRKQIPQGKKIIDINKGAELLKKFALRTTYIDPLNAFTEKCDDENQKEMSLKLLIMKRRNLKDNLRDYFNRWKNNTIRLNDKDHKNDIFAALFKNIMNHNERRILYKRFNQWRQRPKVDVHGEMAKITSFDKILKKILQNNLLNEKQTFFDNLGKTRADRALRNAGGKIFKNYNRKGINELRYYFNRWRKQINKDHVSDLHQQLLRNALRNKSGINNRNVLSKYFARWRLFVSDSKNYDNLDKLKKVRNGGDILSNIYHRRQRDLITRLYRKMGKDYRPTIIKRLINKLEKPRSTLAECFDRWRRICEKQKATENITLLKGKYLNIGIKNVKDRTNRDLLMKFFFKWRIMCKKPEEYYPKISQGFNILSHYFKKNLCDEPFGQIKYHRNFTRPLSKILKNYGKQKDRLMNGKLRNIFGRWRKLIGDKNIKELKTNIIYKTKNYLNNNMKIKLLSKYFTRWKLYRRKGLDVNFTKGLDLITNVFKNKSRQDVFDAYKYKIDIISKEKGAGGLARISEKRKKQLLHNALYKWYRGAMNTDPNRMKKIKTRLRRFIKRNEEEPRAKAFFKWRNKIKMMQFRDKDLLRAKKIIANTIRTRNRQDLNYYMSTWKKKIQLIREQYLKSLLVKQIKSSQMVKEKLNNEARLRSALLKWRSKLVPIDYLDRLKQIRKGCKLFKRSLRKLHERQIFDNIDSLARYNRKNNLLKKFIEELNPKIANYHLKRCIDVWKSKLGDTQRMKNKIHLLFEDYVWSDKVHEGLFKSPKEQLIDLFKQYSNKKKEAADKISNFVKKINLIKEYKQKMLATIKLDKILKNKEKALNDIKKMQFIRYYRQAQKLKNEENSKIIQKFIKEKLRRYFDKRDLIKKGVNVFNTFLKRNILHNIQDKAKDNYTKSVLNNAFIRQENANQESLRNAFNKWKNIIPVLRENEAAVRITNLLRGNKSKNIMKRLKLRLIKLTKIYENYDDKNKKLLDSFLKDWLHRALMIKNNENAEIIQRFCRMKMEEYLDNKAKNNLLNLIQRYRVHKFAKVLERSSRIMGGKGEVVLRTLQDIIHSPYNKLINNLKFISKVNALKKVQPKVHDKLKEYYLPKYLKKWKENTYDVTVRQTKILQKFLRDQYAKKMERDKLRREALLSNIVKRKQRNDLYKLQLPFSIWSKKVKLEKLNSSVNKIQNLFRCHLAKEKQKNLSNQNKWNILFKKVLLNNAVNGLRNAGNFKNLKISQNKILNLILDRKIFNDGQSKLKTYFDKWRRYNQILNKYATQIQNGYRTYLANKEKNRLKRINDILKKTILKHEKTNNDTMRSKLRKWNNKSKLISFDKNSRIIQLFIRPKLAKLLNDKVKNLFDNLSQKRVSKSLLSVAKMYKLLHALNRPSVQKFRNNLQKIVSKKNFNDKLRIISNKNNVKNNNEKLRRYLNKWKDIITNINQKENGSASIIQRAFLSLIARNKRNNLKNKKTILTKYVIQKYNITNNKLYIYFTRWLNKSRVMKINENAKVIQGFCREILQKCKEKKELNNKIKINNGLVKLMKVKFGKEYVFNKIKSEKNRSVFKQFNDNLKKHKLNTLKDCFDKIKQTAFNNKLKSAINIQDNLKERILKKILDTWHEKANKLSRKLGAEIIIKNYRLYASLKKKENREQILKNILLNLLNKNNDMKNKYFKKWKDIDQKIKNNQSKARVARYIKNRFKISKARKNWIKLSKNLKLKNRNNDLYNFVQKIKQFCLIKKFMRPFTDLARKRFISKVQDNDRKDNILQKLKNVLPKRNDTNNEIILRKYLSIWINKINKINDREAKLNEAMQVMSKNKLKSDINTLTDAFLVKKLKHDIPYARAKSFFDKLRNIYDKKNKNEKLANSLKNANDNMNDQHKKQILNKILKLYTYKKLDNMLNACEDYDQKILKPQYGKEFLQKLFLNMKNKAQYNYADRIESTNKPTTTKLKFNKKIIKNNKIIEDKQAIIKKCIPSFVSYLDKKIKERNQNTLNEFKKAYASKKFCELLKSFSNKKIISPKSDVVNEMKREAKYSETRPLYQIKIFKLLRKKYIREIVTKLEEPSRLYKLFYLINVTQMHKKITNQRFFRELIRKWRFIAFTKKMARRKLELMYKNLHASYMQMADEIFGDDEVNPSVIKQFEMFGNNVGMFTAQEPEVGEEMSKKYYTTVDKRYVFKNDREISNEMRKSYTRQKQIIVEKEEMKESEEFSSSEKRPRNKDLSSSFKKIKSGGIQKNLFKKDN